MKYQKPEINLLAPAMDVVQNPLNKEVQQILDTHEEQSSLAAYSADE